MFFVKVFKFLVGLYVAVSGYSMIAATATPDPLGVFLVLAGLCLIALRLK